METCTGLGPEIGEAFLARLAGWAETLITQPLTTQPLIAEPLSTETTWDPDGSVADW